MSPRLILASKSNARRRLLDNAGIKFDIIASQIDERFIKAQCRQGNKTVEKTALKLARAKGELISEIFPEALVISADQILEQNTEWYDKPRDRSAARAQLKALSGNQHRLVTACCVYLHNGEKWHNISIAKMSVRNLSNAFIEEYLDTIGNEALKSVGAYQLEGRGVNLFEAVEGDFFSILGLPLVRLLSTLRQFAAQENI